MKIVSMIHESIKPDSSPTGKFPSSNLTLGIQVGLKEKPKQSIKEVFSIIFSVTSSIFMLIAIILFVFQLFEISFWSSLIALTFLMLRLPLVPFGSHFRSLLLYGAVNILLSYLFYSLMISSSI